MNEKTSIFQMFMVSGAFRDITERARFHCSQSYKTRNLAETITFLQREKI